VSNMEDTRMEKDVSVPRVLVGGVKGKVGKTVLSVGLILALRKKGFAVQPFKVGPDFIDPGYHSAAAGRPSRNLDGYLMSGETILSSFVRHCSGADLAVVEGVMGLFDGVDALSGVGSTAEMARVLGAPVLLVVDAERMTRTAAAVVSGIRSFDPAIRIAGVIVNNVGSARHKEKIQAAIERLAGVPVVGSIPRASLEMPYRHLGLVPTAERKDLEGAFAAMRSLVEENVDVDRVVEIARSAPGLPRPAPARRRARLPHAHLGVFRDEAFSFYYPENLEALQAMFGRVSLIDALRDPSLPEGLDGLYIGGGFPEVYAPQLEENRRLRREVREAAISGMPIYAECGGLIYLCSSLSTLDRGSFEMVGFFDGRVEMFQRPQALGYVRLLAERDNLLSEKGETVLGHEFHYTRIVLEEEPTFAFSVLRGRGIDGRHDGLMKGGVLASYAHVHAASFPVFLRGLYRELKRRRSGLPPS